MAELETGSDFANDFLDSWFHHHTVLVDSLVFSVSYERMSRRFPVQKLATWTEFHDQDELVFKTSFVINYFQQTHNISITACVSKLDHCLDFFVHDLIELIRRHHAVAVFPTMILFLAAQNLFVPYFKDNFLGGVSL